MTEQTECSHFDVCHIVHIRKDHDCPSKTDTKACDYDDRSRPVSASHSSTGRQEPEWKPSPPGDSISDIMEEKGISRLRLGCMLDLRERSISSLLNGNFLIDNDMACRLSEVLGSTPNFWENRERIYRKELRESTNDEHDTAIERAARRQALNEVMLWREENRGKKVGYCTNRIIEDQFIADLMELDFWEPKEYKEKIEQAAREDERRKWRDEHPGDLVWMTPKEEEKRIREEEREMVLGSLIERTKTGYRLKCSDIQSLRAPKQHR